MIKYWCLIHPLFFWQSISKCCPHDKQPCTKKLLWTVRSYQKSDFLGRVNVLSPALHWRRKNALLSDDASFKGILSTSCVIFSYPKLLSISVLTFIKWRLTPSYVAKDTKKTQNFRYQNYCPDDNIQICSYGLLCEHILSMRTV